MHIRWMMAIVLLAFSASAVGCGYCGSEKLLEEARSSKVIAANEMSDKQLEALKEAGVPEKKEKIVWYYDQGLTAGGSEANLVTTKRAIHFKKGKISDIAIDDIESVKHEIGGSSDTITVESEEGTVIVLRFGKFGDSDKMYDALCKKAEGACKNQ